MRKRTAIAAALLACSATSSAIGADAGAGVTPKAFTSQVLIAPAAGGAVTITDSTGNNVLLRVGDNGLVEVPHGLAVGGAVTALRFTAQFDSGWFYVINTAGDIVVPHTLGDVPAFFTVQQCGKLNPDPGGPEPTVGSPSTAACATRTVLAMSNGHQDSGVSINPVNISVDPTNFYVPITNAWWVWGYYSAGSWACPGDKDASCFTGYYRIRAWR